MNEHPQAIALFAYSAARRGSIGPLLATAGDVLDNDEDSFSVQGFEKKIAVVYRDHRRLESEIASGEAVLLLDRLREFQVRAVVIETGHRGMSSEILRWLLTAHAAKVFALDVGGKPGAGQEIVGQLLAIAAHVVREGDARKALT